MKQTRAGLIASCGDIFILLLGIKLWRERWYDEIDHLYINLNNHCRVPDEAVAEFFQNIVNDPKITFVYHREGYGNGPPLVELVKIVREDLICLLEDDFFIFEPGVVDEYFKKIEAGECDLLGSPRYAAGEVAEAAQKRFNLDYSGLGDKGFGWWPTGFYCKKKDLLNTDLDFGSTKYPKGEYITELDHTFKEDAFTDTFTWASIQLRYLGLRDVEIPQNHASPTEIEEHDTKQLKWAGEGPKFIHGGSLSSGWNGYLTGLIPDLSNQNAILEIETRCAFWTIAADVVDGFDVFKKQYREGIENLIVQGNLNRDRISRKIEIYKALMKV